jgi:protease IV
MQQQSASAADEATRSRKNGQVEEHRAESPLRERVRRLLPGLRRLFPAGQVAVVRLHGPIVGGGRSADLTELARHLRESARVPAVVLDIDSPGGSATASDDLYIAFQRLAARKPLVAAIRGTGASGAYLAAMAAHRVLANPTAVVGSIGVISASPRFVNLLERAGVTVTETRAGRLKGMGAPWREDTAEERDKEQRVIEAFYDSFVSRVAEGRKLTPERARELATGEVWLGQQALEMGLVDEIGDVERAIEIAAEMANVPAKGAPVRMRRPFVARLVDRFAWRLGAAISDEVSVRLTDRFRF